MSPERYDFTQHFRDQDKINRGIADHREAGTDHIDDTTARIVASHWHGGQDSALYSFASSGAINHERLLTEMIHALRDVDPDDEEGGESLDALAHYFAVQPDRGVQEGWSERTEW